MTGLPVIGKMYWFEYHCWESPESSDAHLWRRSHTSVEVINISTKEAYGETKEERIANGAVALVQVSFVDGEVFDVFEDELYESPEQFTRPDPPAFCLIHLRFE